MSGQRRRLLADEENAVRYICQWVYIVGKAMKKAKEKKGPKAGGTLTACCRHFSNTHQNGLFYILTMPSTYYLELKIQELPPNYLTESKE